MFQYAVYSFQKYVSLLADAYIVLKILLYFVFAQFEIKQSFGGYLNYKVKEVEIAHDHTRTKHTRCWLTRETHTQQE